MDSTQVDVYLAQFNYECYIYLSATAFFCYDYCLTFSDEVRFVWNARPSVIAVVFYTFRYTALFNTVFMILGLHAWPSWQSDQYSALFYMFVIYEPTLITFPHSACGLEIEGKYGQLYFKLIDGARGSSLLFDLVVLIITWTQLRVAAMDSRGQARVSVVLIRDTTFYFSLQLIVNIIGISIGSFGRLLIPMSTWIAVLTSSLLSRLLFDLRKVSAEGLGMSITHTMETLVFANANSLEDDMVIDTPEVASGSHLDEENI
ncbi:predicted protein [Postia placenta Mad-698-R]|nr:predicted protein [Postia placenta Mad-698-R]